MAAAAVAAAAASTAGAVAQGNAAKKASDAQAEQDVKNAQLADMAAKDAIRQGGVDAAAARAEGTEVISAQRVGFATSGVDVNSGTAGTTQVLTRQLSDFEAETIKVEAAKDAWGLRTQGLNYEKQSKVRREIGRQAQLGGFLSATGYAFQGIGGAVAALRPRS